MFSRLNQLKTYCHAWLGDDIIRIDANECLFYIEKTKDGRWSALSRFGIVFLRIDPIITPEFFYESDI